MNHRHCGNDWLMVLAVLLLMDSGRHDTGASAPEGSGTTSGGTGCGGCLGAVVLLVLLVVGLVAIVHSTHPDPPVTAVSYAQVETSDYAPRALPVDDVLVCRAQLVRLPRSSQR
jgi:hypothetical protein